MELLIASDANRNLWGFDDEPQMSYLGWYCRKGNFYGFDEDLFPDLPPGCKQRLKLVPDGEPIRGDA